MTPPSARAGRQRCSRPPRGAMSEQKREMERMMTLDAREPHGSSSRRAPVVGLRCSLAGRGAAEAPSRRTRITFVFRGKPTVLVASTEHYGAVLNARLRLRAATLMSSRPRGSITPASSRASERALGRAVQHAQPAQGAPARPWAAATIPATPTAATSSTWSSWDDAYFNRLRDFID